jgi:hypothetical protein
MGAGGLSSSSFRNAAVNEGSSLSERLGAMRANLRQQGAQGLFNIGQASLNPVVDTIYNQPQPGFLEQVGPELLTAGATMFGGPAAGAATAGITNSMRNSYGTPKVGRNSSPYGQQGQQPQFMR